MVMEIVVANKIIGRLDPLDQGTLHIEEKLANLVIGPDGKIQGIKPITNRANKTLPPNSGFKRIEERNLILAPEGQHTIIVVGEI